MQLSGGSLQQKKGWWYLVKRIDGRQVWAALHTKDADTAQRLAVSAAPVQALRDDEDKYLLAVVAQGRAAEKRLAEKRETKSAGAVEWGGMFQAWQESADGLTTNRATLKKYACQFSVLSAWAASHGISSPAAMTHEQVQCYASERMKATVVSGRDVALFRRVWRDLKLGDAWADVTADAPNKSKNRYRRLTLGEVRALVATARSGKSRVRHPGGWFEKGGYDALPDVANLITVAYHTGLRLRDCATLSASNVDGAFLRVVPEKTSNRKVKPLLIPLQPEADAIVRRLTKKAGKEGRLFPRLADASLSKSLRLTFERSEVPSNQFGKASFHSLRATFISMMDEAGVPPHVTDAITGHAPQGMHGRYSQPGRDSLMDAVKRAIVPLGV